MRGLKHYFLITAIIALPIALGNWVVQTEITSNAREKIGHTLTTVRDTTRLAVRTWFKDQKAAALAWAETAEIRALTTQLLTLPARQSTLLNSSAQAGLRNWFIHLQNATHYQGYFVVGPGNINLASSRDQNVGTKNLLIAQPDFLHDVWAGKSSVSLPIRSDVAIEDSHGHQLNGVPSMFVAAPIRSRTGNVIAIFMFRLDPEEGFTNILRLARIGNTGETYAFDDTGRLISQSRFDNLLHASGNISAGEHAILNIQLRDPGINLLDGEKTDVPRNRQPLTRMVKSAIRGKADVDLAGYRDYRGVSVVGAWVWDTELGLGIATEIDVQEAYQSLRIIQRAITAFSLFIVVLLISLTIIYTLLRKHKKVEAELRRAATVFDNTDEGIIITNDKVDIIMVNNAFTDITGYTSGDVLGKNPKFQRSGRHDEAFYKSMWNTLKRDDHWRGEIWNRRSNGEIYPAWENINAVKDSQGHITNYVSIFSDISILKESEERLAHLAHHDNLTGLPNRLRFIANLEQALEGAKRHKYKVALLFLDLDKFKQTNDTHGHNVGDELLKIVADRLKNCVRAEDTVARLGGDEFTVVLTDVSRAEDAGLIADKIICSIRKPISIGGEIINTSASVGICIYPDDAIEYEGMVKTADAAMYHAKAMGRNSFQFYTADMAKRTREYAQLEKELRTALNRDEFELYYQPQVNLNDGRIAGLEALIRWNHPEHGQLLPEAFIHVADDSNLIDAISEWVLHTALNDYKSWSVNGSIEPRIAVNITARQIARKQGIIHILKVLEKHSPKPDVLQLDLEITEDSLEQTDHTINSINMLKEHGVMFAIDDFGTGHSSMSLLKKLPVDALKIDRSFIHDITSQSDGKAITAAIIAMAHSLGLRVIAEGVETRSQLNELRSLNCDEIQGFYFSKPVPASEIPRLLDKSFQ